MKNKMPPLREDPGGENEPGGAMRGGNSPASARSRGRAFRVPEHDDRGKPRPGTVLARQG
ncbi:hypothetical protein [Thermococcus sp. JCM 11816]|uniref:hypothetical protein n=1 Tax=Thermococcus sp. (strain JCM 11816 / KS-1) TaxID=1295125 RepID=UPI003466B28D